MRSLNCELGGQFENFASASGRDVATHIGIPLNCELRGHFGNFASASGRNLANSPLFRSTRSFNRNNAAWNSSLGDIAWNSSLKQHVELSSWTWKIGALVASTAKVGQVGVKVAKGLGIEKRADFFGKSGKPA